MAIKYLVFNGKVQPVECENHSMAYGGHMPCTGVYRCIHCGIIGEDPLRNYHLLNERAVDEHTDSAGGA